jgi:hypothetical protein
MEIWMKWTPWKKIEAPSERSEPAAYRIALLDAAGVPLPLSRMLGIDRDGLLSIGKTTSMESRRRQFVSGMTRCYGHSEGNLLHLLLRYSRLKEIVANATIVYQFVDASTDKEAKSAEARLLKDYLIRFGELPPLNSAIPNRYDEQTWCEIERM